MSGLPDGFKPEDLVEIMGLYKQSGGEMDPSKVPPDVRPYVELFQNLSLQGVGQDDHSNNKNNAFDAASASHPDLFNVLGNSSSSSSSSSGGGASAERRKNVQEIVPEAGFVVKCRDDNDRKIFINMCGSERVAAPGNWDKDKIPEDVMERLNKAEVSPDESLRFPLSLSDASYDLDKAGQPCTTFDCIFNLDVLKQAMAEKRLKVFLIELALGWVQEKHHLILDSKYKLPRMKYKGKDVQAQNIRKDDDDTKPIIEEIDGGDEEEKTASFPLMMNKRKHTVNTQAKAMQQKKMTTAASTGSQKKEEDEEVGAKKKKKTPRAARYSIDYQGKPCSELRVKVDTTGLLKTGYDASMVSVHLVGSEALEVCFDCKGYPGNALDEGEKGEEEEEEEEPVTLKVDLPFAVSPPQHVEVGKDGNLSVSLRYKPYEEMVEEMKLAAPHTFGTLNLSDSSFLDLE